MTVIFDAEHLVNLEMSVKFGPEQAIIRLHQLHSSKSLQPAKVHLRLEANHLSIINKETDRVVEKFPYPEVEAHEELFVRSVSDRHKNLLLLTVVDSFALVPPEFFILQFSSASPVAKEFLDKFKDFKNNYRSNSDPSTPQQTRSSEHQAFTLSDFQAKQAAHATLKYKAPIPHKSIDMCLYGEIKQEPQQSQQLLNKYMELLNHCLDDVEAFVVRLRVAASNYQELQGWREEKQIGAHGGGIRMMRSQPPPPQEFHAIFQKMKLAFNILPKLKGHIKSPNAPELVHFLFNPLDLVVEASCAVLASNEEPIWEHTITPLFNIDTLRLFDDCLLSNEADLLRFLGTAWNITASERDFWLSCVSEVPAYKPTFADGWFPSDDVMSNLSIPIHPSNHQQPPLSQFSPSQQLSPSQQFSPPQRAFSQLQQPQPLEATINHVEAPSSHDARPNHLPLEGSFLREKVTTTSDPSIRKSHSPTTLQIDNSPTVPPPISYIAQLPHSPPSSHDKDSLTQNDFVNSILSKGSMAYIVIVDRAASNDQELDAMKGEAFEVLESNRLHSKVRTSLGLIGYLPSNILQPLNLISEDLKTEIGVTKQRSLTTMDHLNMEFQHKLTHQTPDVPKKKNVVATLFINEKSSPQDVAAWLVSKGFDESVQGGLASFGGKQLFVMDKRVLERLFGVEVGGRLISQILVQRNKSGYKTMRAKELNAILEGRKKKAGSIELSGLFKSDPDPNLELTEQF